MQFVFGIVKHNNKLVKHDEIYLKYWVYVFNSIYTVGGKSFPCCNSKKWPMFVLEIKLLLKHKSVIFK